MKRRTYILLALSVVAGSGLWGFQLWKRGTPYQQPYWSPNGSYYVQKYSNLSFGNVLPAMPGGGSDKIDGYIRLYDRQGRLLHERFVPFIRDVEPVWDGNTVYLLGVETLDDALWTLPTSSE